MCIGSSTGSGIQCPNDQRACVLTCKDPEFHRIESGSEKVKKMKNVQNFVAKHYFALLCMIALALFCTAWFYPLPAIGTGVSFGILIHIVSRERELKKVRQELLATEAQLSVAKTTVQRLEPSLQEEIKRAETAEEKCDRLDRDLKTVRASLEQNRETVQLAVSQRDKLAEDLHVANEAVKNLDRLKALEHEQVLAWSFRLRAPHESVNPPKEVIQKVTREMETWVRGRLPTDRVDAILYRHQQETDRKAQGFG